MRELDASALWCDPAPHRRRREKTAAALVAIRDALARNRPLGGREDPFLRLYDRVARAPGEAVAEILAEPGAYNWVRTAFELVASVVGGAELSPAASARWRASSSGEPVGALREHIDSFAALALGVALRARISLDLPAPWRPPLPHALLGSPWVLEAPAGAGVELLGASGEELVVRLEGERLPLRLPPETAQRAGVRLRASAIARCGGVALRLQPEAFLLPGFEAGASLGEIPRGYQSEHEPLVTAALARIERHAPDAWRELALAVPLAAFKPEPLGGLTNFSHSELPGAFVASVVGHADLLADSIVHEVFHGRLFALEEVAPFFEPEDADRMLAEEHYSPWRSELRPLHGILHAVYVHVPVWRFWASVREESERGSLARLLADDRLARVGLQLEIGLGAIRRHARMSEYGEALAAGLAREVEAIGEWRRALGLGVATAAADWDEAGGVEPLLDAGGTAVTVGEELRAHVRRVAPDEAERVEAALV